MPTGNRMWPNAISFPVMVTDKKLKLSIKKFAYLKYVCANNGFRYTTGTARAREIVLKYLYQHGYSQVLVINDLLVSGTAVESELTALKIPYSKIEDKDLGAMLVVSPGANNKPIQH